MDIDIPASARGFPEFAKFFTQASHGRLSFPRCEDCERFHWYPMKRCPHCRSERLRWVSISPSGTLYSWTRVEYAFDRDIEVPYVVGLLEFAQAPGVRLITNLIDVDPEGVTFDMVLTADFARFQTDPSRLCFRPAN